MNYIIHKLTNITLITGVMTAMLLTACDEGFKEMNMNPNAYTEPVLSALFTTSIIRTVGSGINDRGRINLKYLSGAIQYHGSLATNWYGEKGVIYVESGDFFDMVYTNHLRELAIIISETKDKDDLVNQNAIARIWHVYAFHQVTDSYGDVPYKDALNGMEGNYKPKYDKQSDIYSWMLQDLELAINQMDPSKESFGAADVVYQGDIQKWKTFGYSLMLRLGMRLTNVDQAMSKTWVQKAIAGGVMQSNKDLAILKHYGTGANTRNTDAYVLKREMSESGKGNVPAKMGKPFIDLLQAYNDPRLPFYATLWQGNINAQQLQVITQTTLPELQKGLPNGYDATTISQAVPSWTSNMITTYSEPNTATVGNYSAPSIILSYSEIEFLLAEATIYGWATPETPEVHYEKAIIANMESASLFPNSNLLKITQTEINDYLAAHPLTGTDEDKLKQIHTQFYLAHYMYFDFFEAWSTWRRTGVPTLSPITYPLNSTGGAPIRRLIYSSTEKALNGANLDAAIAIQGADTYLTRVWWDKK